MLLGAASHLFPFFAKVCSFMSNKEQSTNSFLKTTLTMVINFSLRHMPKVIYIRFGIIIVQEYLNSELTKVSFLLYNRILRNT